MYPQQSSPHAAEALSIGMSPEASRAAEVGAQRYGMLFLVGGRVHEMRVAAEMAAQPDKDDPHLTGAHVDGIDAQLDARYNTAGNVVDLAARRAEVTLLTQQRQQQEAALGVEAVGF